MTKLDVINSMLATMGQAPLNELDARHPHVASGLRILEQKNASCQLNGGAGYWFNTLDTFTLRQDIAGKVSVPEDLIKFTPKTYPDRYGVVAGYLHDNINDTNIIGENVEVHAIRKLAFEDLPVLANDYIAMTSILTFQREYDGDLQKTQLIREDEQKAWVNLRMQDIREKRANTKRNPQVALAMSRFSSAYGVLSHAFK
jgi:hypothetical protein